jgi:hypothetical protein
LNVSLADLPDEAAPEELGSVLHSWQNMHGRMEAQLGSKIHLQVAPDLLLNFREIKHEAPIPSIVWLLHSNWDCVIKLLNPGQRFGSIDRSRSNSV